jgi:hypothetical protein
VSDLSVWTRTTSGAHELHSVLVGDIEYCAMWLLGTSGIIRSEWLMEHVLTVSVTHLWGTFYA